MPTPSLRVPGSLHHGTFSVHSRSPARLCRPEACMRTSGDSEDRRVRYAFELCGDRGAWSRRPALRTWFSRPSMVGEARRIAALWIGRRNLEIDSQIQDRSSPPSRSSSSCSNGRQPRFDTCLCFGTRGVASQVMCMLLLVSQKPVAHSISDFTLE